VPGECCELILDEGVVVDSHGVRRTSRHPLRCVTIPRSFASRTAMRLADPRSSAAARASAFVTLRPVLISDGFNRRRLFLTGSGQLVLAGF
jgi:hypothetical protein